MALLLLLRPVLLLSLLLSAPILRSQAASGSIAEEEDFSEELLLRPLQDRKVLAHFHFRSRAPHTSSNGCHHHLFPKAISQLGFLHIDEYPPDANQGFDIPSAIISFPHFHTSIQFFKDKSVDKSSILSRFQENSAVLAYTEVLLVPLTTPDFSMPYNVITITCTIYALYFGALLNVLRRRVGKEERLAKSKGLRNRVSCRWKFAFSSMPINLVGPFSCDLGCLLSLEEDHTSHLVNPALHHPSSVEN